MSAMTLLPRTKKTKPAWPVMCSATTDIGWFATPSIGSTPAEGNASRTYSMPESAVPPKQAMGMLRPGFFNSSPSSATT